MPESKKGNKIRKPFYRHLYVQVLFGVVLGAAIGLIWPEVAAQAWVKALGDGFVRLIRMTIAVLIFCTVVSGIGPPVQGVRNLIDQGARIIFDIITLIMKLAPIGAGAAMAYTLGKFGAAALGSLLMLIGAFYLTAVLFVVIVLGVVAWLTGFIGNGVACVVVSRWEGELDKAALRAGLQDITAITVE